MRRSKQMAGMALGVAAVMSLVAPGTAMAEDGPATAGGAAGGDIGLVVDLEDVSSDQLETLAGDAVVTEVYGTDQAVVQVAAEDADEVAADLAAAGAPVLEVDPRVEATLDPADAHWSSQTGFPLVGIPSAWDVTTGGDSVIAVIDTGVNPVSELAGRLLPGWDFVDDDADATDLNGHGTQAATVAAGAGNNGIAAAGACWSCQVLPVRVLDSVGSGSASDVAAGINWAVNQGADVINLSLGTSSYSLLMDQAVVAAHAAGVVVVAAAGNSGNTIPNYPANSPGAIAVGAVTSTGELFSYSNRGAWVDVAAPGLNVSQDGAGNTAFFNGTSSASPVVAGVAALALAADPARTPDQVTALVKASGPVFPGLGGPLLDARRVAVPAGLADFGPLSPARLLDTRGLPTADGVRPWVGRVPAGATVELPVTGRAGVPGWADSVVLNVTATETDSYGFVTAWPCGSARPNASNLNFEPGQTVPNLVVSKIGQGKVCLFSAGGAHLVADVAAYLPAGATFGSSSPVRLLDTRGLATADGGRPWVGMVGAGSVVPVPVTGRAGVPAGAGAVVMNVTVADSQSHGYVTAFPCGAPVPLASNLNFVPGQTVPNLVVSQVGAGGQVCLYTAGAAHLVVDVAAWFPAGADFASSSPQRLLDTRPSGTVDGHFQGLGRLGAGQWVEVQVAGRGSVPAGATSAVLNVTAADPAGAGYVTVWPCDGLPLASNLNFRAGLTVPNLVMSRLSSRGTVCLYTAGPTDLVADVAGWFTA